MATRQRVVMLVCQEASNQQHSPGEAHLFADGIAFHFLKIGCCMPYCVEKLPPVHLAHQADRRLCVASPCLQDLQYTAGFAASMAWLMQVLFQHMHKNFKILAESQSQRTAWSWE